MNFWVWDTKNILERLWGKTDVLEELSANSGHFVTLGNSKNLGFSVFFGNFGNFFCQNTIFDQIVPRTIKNGFSDIL